MSVEQEIKIVIKMNYNAIYVHWLMTKSWKTSTM